MSDPSQFPGSYSIIVDPCLKSPAEIASVLAAQDEDPKPVSEGDKKSPKGPLSSIADLPEPDMVIVTSSRPDRCDEETLCQLSPHVQCIILASRAAARKIKSWRHFDESIIDTILPYKPDTANASHFQAVSPNQDVDSDDELEPEFLSDDKTNLYRVTLPAFSSMGEDGHISFALVPGSKKSDPVAIGITYQAPRTILSSSIALRPHTSQTQNIQSDAIQQTQLSAGLRPATSIGRISTSPLHPQSQPVSPPLPSIPQQFSNELTSPISSGKQMQSPYQQMPNSPMPVLRHCTLSQERPVSLLYAPDGFSTNSYSQLSSFSFSHRSLLTSYVYDHLIRNAALPLTCLIHPFDAPVGQKSWWSRRVPFMNGISASWRKWKNTSSQPLRPTTSLVEEQAIVADSNTKFSADATGGAMLVKVLRARTWVCAPPSKPHTPASAMKGSMSNAAPLSPFRLLGRKKVDSMVDSAPTPNSRLSSGKVWTVEEVQALLKPSIPKPSPDQNEEISMVNSSDILNPSTPRHNAFARNGQANSQTEGPQEPATNSNTLSHSGNRLKASPSPSPPPSGNQTARTSTGSSTSTAPTSLSVGEASAKPSELPRPSTSCPRVAAALKAEKSDNGCSAKKGMEKNGRPCTASAGQRPQTSFGGFAPPSVVLGGGSEAPIWRTGTTTEVVQLSSGQNVRAGVIATS